MEIKADNKNLIISFDYNPVLVSIVGKFNSRKFNPKTKEWTVPKVHINQVVNTLLPLGFTIDDSIKADYIQELKRKKKIAAIREGIFNEKEVALFNEVNLPLFNFQKIGAGFLCVAKSALLGDDPGLGKSIQSLTTTILKNAKKTLIVCPSSLKLSWQEEIAKWAPTKKVVVITGSKAERDNLWKNEDAEYVIINYELLLRDIEEIRKKQWQFIIADEATRISNPKSKQAKLIKTIKADYKLPLTGTPLNNAVHDLWNIMDFCKPGLLGSFWQFTERYCEKDRWGGISGYKNLSELKVLIADNMLRRKKEDVMTELPEKIYENVYIELDKEEKEIYKAVKEEIKNTLKEFEVNRVLEDRFLSNVMVKMIRLKQVTGSLELVCGRRHSSKLDTVKELLTDILHGTSKVIIFTQFSEMADILIRELSDFNPLLISGKVDNNTRQENVHKFQDDTQNHKVLVMTEAGAYGLNLQKANYIIHYDLPWSISKMEQREGRAHRIGQKQNVTIYNMLALGTVDEYVYKVLMKKQRLSENILGDKERIRKVKISKRDIHNLLA